MKTILQAGLRHTAKFEVTRDRATHMPFIVDVASAEKRLAAKAAKAELA